MKRISTVMFAVAAALLLLSGCASDKMMAIPAPAAATAPPEGKATVVFLRTSFLGSAIQSTVFDVTSSPADLVGIISVNKKLAYVTDPGPRRFMVVSEAADFMDADLLAGRTYFVRITPRMGMWKARFSLAPIPASTADLESDLAGCTWIDNTAASRDWARSNMADILAKKADYLPEWTVKANKPLLKSGDGR